MIELNRLALQPLRLIVVNSPPQAVFLFRRVSHESSLYKVADRIDNSFRT